MTEMLQGSPPCVWCQSGSTLRSSGFCCVCRKHLQEIPSSSTNVSTSLEWDSSKTSELLSGMGASALKKDKLGNENTPQDLLMSSPCLPPKRQKVKDNEKDFVILRRPWLLREAESGTITLLHCLLFFCSYPAELLDLVAFRLGVINPVLCMHLNRGDVSGSTFVPMVLCCLPLRAPVCVCWGACAACPSVCLLLSVCVGHGWHLGPAGALL